MKSDQKEKTPRDKKYLLWQRTQPCANPYCCKTGNDYESVVPAHNKGGGVSNKSSDYEALPLCNTCHQREHLKGFDTFWKGIDRERLVKEHLERYRGKI